MFKKIDIHYKDIKGKVHYLHSTIDFKYVYLAVEYAKTMMKLYTGLKRTANKKVGEEIVVSRIFGRIDKTK